MKARGNSIRNTLNYHNRTVLTTTLLLCCAVLAILSTARGSATLVLSSKWTLAEGSRYYLPSATASDPRGVGLNPVTGDILIPSIQGGSNHVAVLDANGNDLGSLSGTGVTGGTKAICLVGASDDGVIYGCNLAISGQGFIVYRWPAEDVTGATPPLVLALNTPFGVTGGRLGDSFAVRGAGTNTQFIVSGSGMSKFAVFTTTDGTNFTPTVFNFPSGLAAGQAERGLCFDSTNNACFATKETGTAVHYLGFNLGTATATWLGDFTAGQAWSGISVAYLTAFTTNTLRVLAGVYDNGASGPGTHQLQVYDISSTNSPVLSTNSPFPTPVGGNANETGGAAIGNGMIVGFDTDNGLQALTIGFQANVPPSIASQPGNQTVLQTGTASFSVTASGSSPLHYQWYFNTNTIILNATNTTLTITNLQLTDAGTYNVMVTNAYGTNYSDYATLTVTPGVFTVAETNLWKLAPGSLPFLDSSSYNTRGLAFNAASDHVLVSSHAPVAAIHVLNADNGAFLWDMDMTQVTNNASPTFGDFLLNMVGVADDGKVYAAGLSRNGTNFAMYSWPDDSASSIATMIWNPQAQPPIGAGRLGDTLAVRGAGPDTQILLGTISDAGGPSAVASNAVLFTTTDGSTFTPYVITPDGAPNPADLHGFAGHGVAFGQSNTFWAKDYGFNFRLVAFDPVLQTNGIVQNFNAATAVGPIGVDNANGLLSGIDYVNPDNLELFDIYDYSTGPVLLDQRLFPGFNANVQYNGAVAFDVAGGRIFALDANNGILALKYAPPLRSSFSGGQLILNWAGPAVLLRAANVVGPYAPVLGASSPYTNVVAGQVYYRLRR